MKMLPIWFDEICPVVASTVAMDTCLMHKKSLCQYKQLYILINIFSNAFVCFMHWTPVLGNTKDLCSNWMLCRESSGDWKACCSHFLLFHLRKMLLLLSQTTLCFSDWNTALPKRKGSIESLPLMVFDRAWKCFTSFWPIRLHYGKRQQIIVGLNCRGKHQKYCIISLCSLGTHS